MILSRLAIIIPVRGSEPKRRLDKILTLEERKLLQALMLQDMLKNIAESTLIKNTYIVSSNSSIVDNKKYESVRFILEKSEKGVNAAVELAITELADYDGWLLLPADLPLFSEADLKMVVMLLKFGFDLIISPSRKFDGTNLLLMLKDKSIKLHYDDQSFKKHLEEARKKRLNVVTYFSKGVSLDIDDESDVEEFMKYGKGTLTGSFLSKRWNR